MSQSKQGGSVQRALASLVGKPAFWLTWVLVLMIGVVGRSMARELPKPPQLKLALPAFHLVDQDGKPFGSSDLVGKIWVADFIFTSCPTVCPKLTERMVRIQHRTRNLGDAFHLVSFTVDPENDTPEKLRAFASLYHPNMRRWSFVTGSLADIEGTVIKGFKIAMGKEETAPGLFGIFHGERFVLVDQQGAIRGYYENSDESIDKLMLDISILANMPGS